MSNWKALQDAVKTRFGSELDHEALLFIIGLQELAQVNRSFKKQEKLEIMHIAVCVLLAPYGFYKYTGRDADGWPHFESLKSLPSLTPKQQHRLVTEAMLHYFTNQELI